MDEAQCALNPQHCDCFPPGLNSTFPKAKGLKTRVSVSSKYLSSGVVEKAVSFYFLLLSRKLSLKTRTANTTYKIATQVSFEHTSNVSAS